MRFSVYLHKLVISDGTLIERKFIVLKDENGLIVSSQILIFLSLANKKSRDSKALQVLILILLCSY